MGFAVFIGGIIAYYYGRAIFLSNFVAVNSGKANFEEWINLIAGTCGLLRGLPMALLALVFTERPRELTKFTWIGSFALIFTVMADLWPGQPNEPHLKIALDLVKGVIFAGVVLTGLYFARIHLLKNSVMKLNRGVLTSL